MCVLLSFLAVPTTVISNLHGDPSGMAHASLHWFRLDQCKSAKIIKNLAFNINFFLSEIALSLFSGIEKYFLINLWLHALYP